MFSMCGTFGLPRPPPSCSPCSNSAIDQLHLQGKDCLQRGHWVQLWGHWIYLSGILRDLIYSVCVWSAFTATWEPWPLKSGSSWLSILRPETVKTWCLFQASNPILFGIELNSTNFTYECHPIRKLDLIQLSPTCQTTIVLLSSCFCIWNTWDQLCNWMAVVPSSSFLRNLAIKASFTLSTAGSQHITT